MAQTIKLKRSSTSGATPTTSQLELGEVAINTYDGKMFIKKNDGSDSIVEVGSSSDATSSAEVSTTLTATGNLAQGDPVAIKSDGTVTKIGTATSIAAATGSSVIFNAPNDANGGLRDAGHMQIAYDGNQYGIVTGVDDGDGDKGCFRVFSVSGTTITLLGTTSTKINDLDVDYPHAIVYDSSLSKFVLYGRNKPSSEPGGAHIHMITLDSSGNATVDSGHYHSNSINTSAQPPELLLLGSGRLALVAVNASSRLFIQIIEYSNNTWVWGTAYYPEPDEGQQRTIRASKYDGKIVIIWRSGNPDKGLGVVADPGSSGSTVTLGSLTQLVTGDPNYRILAADVSSSGKYLFTASPNQNNASGYHNVYVGDINSTNKTFSTPTVTTNVTKYMYQDIVWEEAISKFILTGQRQSGDDKVSRRIITLDSSDGATYGSEILLDNVNIQEDAVLNTVNLGNGLSINAWYENQGSESLQSGILQLRQEAVTGSGAPVTDYIGISKSAVTDGNTATIVLSGTAPANVGLTKGSLYYLTSGGVFSTTNTGYGPIGKAITTSQLILRPLGVDGGADSTSVGTALTGFTTGTDADSSDLIPYYDVSAGTWEKGTITSVALQGPAGADGADGATGPQGPQGDTGPAGADGSDATVNTTNVTAAGALMDSEVTNLAQVKAFDSADYATAAQGTTADNALPKSGGAMTGAITTNSTFDGRDVSADGAKLDGIESGATADQTASEIRTLVDSATDSNVFTDADHTKLDGIETGATADQTASEILTAIKTVDGSGSGLDADTVDGIEANSFLQTTGGSLSGNLTVSYTGNSTNDAGVYVNNDASDWGIKVSKASGADYGLLVETNGNNALVVRNTSGAEGFAVQSDGTVHLGGSEIMGSSAALQVNGFQRTGTIYLHEGTDAVAGNNWPLSTTSGGELRWNSNKVWTAGNDGSGSGLDADLLDGLQPKSSSGSTGANQILRSHSNNYFYHNSWIQVGGSGLFSTTTNGAHFNPNTTTSYGTWRSSGSRGGYDGIVFDGGGDVAIMYDGSGNGGLYRQANGRWHIYHHVGNNCLAVGGSSTSSTYELYVHGDIYATANITAYSDARIKENVVTIDSALEKVESMRGVYYNKIDDPDKTKEVGFIAQEVNEVIPEAVTYAEDVDQYGVKYANITALLVESVKELSQQVKDLQAEVKELKENV